MAVNRQLPKTESLQEGFFLANYPVQIHVCWYKYSTHMGANPFNCTQGSHQHPSLGRTLRSHERSSGASIPQTVAKAGWIHVGSSSMISTDTITHHEYT